MPPKRRKKKKRSDMQKFHDETKAAIRFTMIEFRLTQVDLEEIGRGAGIPIAQGCISKVLENNRPFNVGLTRLRYSQSTCQYVWVKAGMKLHKFWSSIKIKKGKGNGKMVATSFEQEVLRRLNALENAKKPQEAGIH